MEKRTTTKPPPSNDRVLTDLKKSGSRGLGRDTNCEDLNLENFEVWKVKNGKIKLWGNSYHSCE